MRGISVTYLDIEPIFKLNNKYYDKSLLRKKYGFKQKDLIISHVGHNTEGRGLDIIYRLAKLNPTTKFLLVLSKRKKHLKIRQENIKLIQEYVSDINEIYSISDIYIFPLKKSSHAIDVPLSILEAKSFGISIIVSDQGYIREAIKDYGKGYTFYYSNKLNQNIEEINKIIEGIKNERQS